MIQPCKATAYLIRLYLESGKTVDELPYTTAIRVIVREMQRRFNDSITEAWVYDNLMYLRKAGYLPRTRHVDS